MNETESMKKKSKRKGGIVGLCKTRTCMNMYERSSKSFSLNGSKLKTPKWVDSRTRGGCTAVLDS